MSRIPKNKSVNQVFRKKKSITLYTDIKKQSNAFLCLRMTFEWKVAYTERWTILKKEKITLKTATNLRRKVVQELRINSTSSKMAAIHSKDYSKG